ncbi:DMT family transporter [Fictibacillus iocasae]|uniref:DMT family transporter n=1 Tax=Fictibacillus iocasae TaxID=2715437 RepID=A0ABW2NRL3_9BACL
MNKARLLADVSLLSVAAIWGTTFVIVQQAISSLEPYSFNAVRFFLAFLFLFLFIVFFKRKVLLSLSSDVAWKGIALGFFLYLGYGFQTVGLLYTTSAKAGFITGLSVVLVPVLSFCFMKSKLTLQSIISSCIALIGLYLLALGKETEINKGDFYVLLCAFSFALHIVFVGKFTKKETAWLMTLIQLLMVAFCSLATALVLEDFRKMANFDVLFSAEVLSALLVTALFATALAFLAQTYFQVYTTPARVALIFATEPVFAAVTAYFWLQESLSTKALFGCLFILTGMIAAELPLFSRNKKTSEKAA